MHDVFDKCRDFSDAHAARHAGVYPYFHPLASATGPEVTIDGRPMLMFAANDYLGLATDPRVTSAAARALEQYGTGCGASRFLAGTLQLHEELEAALARFFGKEAAVVFATGMQTSLGVIAALAGADDTVVTDRLVHASVLDGCRLSAARLRRFTHNHVDGLGRILAQEHAAHGILVVIEGVYSMEGDVAPVPAILTVAHAHGARVLLDDAHGVGVLGMSGAGTAEHFGCLGATDLVMATFSKAFGAIGGVVAGDAEVIDYIKHHARSMIFSAALPPALTAGVGAALEIIQREPERRKAVLDRAAELRAALARHGFNTGASTTPIVPLIVGSRDGVAALWRALYDQGIFTSLIIPPAVPHGHELLRLTVSAAHTAEHIARLVDACADIARRLDIPRRSD